MTAPTFAETYSQLTEHIRKAQEAAATLAHLTREGGSKEDHVIANAWLTVSELFKDVNNRVISLAKRRLY